MDPGPAAETASRPDGEATLSAGLSFHALLAAGGRGERFGAELPKQFHDLLGRPVILHTLARLLAAGAASVVIALPREVPAVILKSLEGEPRARLVVGGDSRQASVGAALAASPAGRDDLVVVQDGARPATAPSDLLAALLAARASGAAVLGRRVSDTLKELDGDRIRRTVDRRGLFRAETPQVFRREILERGYQAAARDRFVGTDESALVERLGDVDIVAVEARYPNPKLTRVDELHELGVLLGRLAGAGS